MSQSTSSGVSAIVLAAGSSTRMGSLKPLVHVGGEAMLQRVLSTVTGSRVDEIVVVLGHSAQLIRDSISFGHAKSVINNSYQQGMASSIQIGLSNVNPEAEAALIVLADQPFLDSRTIDLLIEGYLLHKPEIVIPVYQGFRGNPVLLARALFCELTALSGDVGCRAIFGNHAHGILTVPVDDAGVLADFDTPADVRHFQSAEASGSDLLGIAKLSGREVTDPSIQS